MKEGIIVRSQKYQENSKIITIVTEGGLDTYLVRGALKLKSRNFSYSNELTKISFDAILNKHSFNILTTGKILNNYSSIKTNYDKLNDTLLILEIINKLGDHVEDFNTFYDFIDDILLKINDNDYNPYYLIIFRLKLLYLLGLAPVFTKCVVCEEREELVGFDFLAGGMKCSGCRTNADVLYNEDVIKVLKYLYLTKLTDIELTHLDSLEFATMDAKLFLDRYYDYYLGYKSSAEKIINRMNKL